MTAVVVVAEEKNVLITELNHKNEIKVIENNNLMNEIVSLKEQLEAAKSDFNLKEEFLKFVKESKSKK